MSNAKLQHQQLFDAIALRNSQVPVAPAAPQHVQLPVETAAVSAVRSQFAAQFDQASVQKNKLGKFPTIG